MLTFEGILSIVAGVAAFAWPGLTVLVFVMLMAAWAIVTGGLMLGGAFRLSGRDGVWWLALGGIASILFGILLILAPLAGAIVLTWWVGAYALVFGIFLLIFAFRLKSQRDRRDAGLAQGTVRTSRP